MLITWKPRQTKFKRLQKGIIKKCNHTCSATRIQQGILGLRILKSGILTSKQLEQARRKMLKFRKKKEKQKIWFHCVPDVPITRKPLGIRMGKGKGAPKHWISKLISGKVIMQLNYLSRKRAKKALRAAKKILPVPTKIVFNKAARR